MSNTSQPDPRVRPPIGVTGARIDINASTGVGTITGTEHLLDGSTPPLPPITVQPHQIAIGMQALPRFSQTLAAGLSAKNNVADPGDLADTIALVLTLLALPAPPATAQQPTAFTGPDATF